RPGAAARLHRRARRGAGPEGEDEPPADPAGRRAVDDGRRQRARGGGRLPAEYVRSRGDRAFRKLVQGLLRNPFMTTTAETQTLDALLDSIRTRAARVGVIGLGYVGLPLVLLFEEAGFPVLGFDVDTKK